MPRFRTLTCLLLAAAALAPAAASADTCSAVAGAHFAGLGGDDSFNDPSQADCVMSRQAAAGAGTLRQPFSWADIEVAPGVYRFDTYDRWMAAAARHGMRVLPVLATPPSFQSLVAGPYMSPPRSMTAYGQFVAAVARRYGPNGTFWAAHPELPRDPIHDYQIWNEPNLPQYWGGTPSARGYVSLLKAGYQAVKSVDPTADVVTAGMPESLITGAIPVSKFLPELYAAGGAAYFDTLAINPYAPTAADVLAAVQQTRVAMDGAGDRSGSLWVTEVGWGTGGPASRFNIGAAGQSTQLGALLTGLWNRRAAYKLRGVDYYGWRDRAPYAPLYKDMWGLHTGLLDINGSPKPAFSVFARLAPQMVGDTVLPHVAGDAPTPPPAKVGGANKPAAPKLVLVTKPQHRASSFTVRCSAKCKVTAKLTVSKGLARKLHMKGRTLASLVRTLGKGKSSKLTLRLRKLARKAHVKRITATLSVTVRDAAGHKRTQQRRVTIKV